MRDDVLPDGRDFSFWDDETEYRRVYHVAQGHAEASDQNDGSAAKPFRTLQRAAEVLRPREKVVVHAGIYRETVSPVHGGTGPDAMIAYEAAPGETVILRGSVPWRPAAQPSEGWGLGAPLAGVTIWMADLPVDLFGAYNPFLARNVYDHLYCYGERQDPEWMQRALRRRGMVFFDGQPLKQVLFARDLARQDASFWVEEPGLRVHFRLPADRPPAECELEVTAREQVFAPRAFGLGYLRVTGFSVEHAADGLPVPQRAALSTSRGHHWILEDNSVRWANGCGMDVGLQSWNAAHSGLCGHHIIRRNRIAHCGVCGIAGARGVEHTLIEDNVLEHVGFQDLERMYECAAIKFHFCKHSLMRRNVFRHLKHAGGIWLDVDNENCRITGSTFADIETITGAVYSEMNFEINVIDHNVFWDIRSGAMKPGDSRVTVEGSAIRADCNESLVVAHNLFGHIRAHAVAFSLVQADRPGGSGRTGLCRANLAVNNVFVRCPHRIHLARREENVCDGNLYDVSDHRMSFEIALPEPGCRQDLPGWQRYFGLDEHSTEGAVEARLDAESNELTWSASEEAMPVCRPLAPPISEDCPGPRKGGAVRPV